MNITIYDETGKILRTISGVGNPEQWLQPGEKYIEGTGIDPFQYVENDALVNIPPSPGNFYYFDYAAKKWVLDTVALERYVRARIDGLLASTDWTQDTDVVVDVKQKFAEYRQLLEDIPQQPGYPENVVWPTPPAK